MSISISRFGKDHWSTFAYIETRIVDYKGVPNPNHLRIDTGRHPGIRGDGWGSPKSSAEYPTRLRIQEDGQLEKVPNHDDIDCLEDLEEAGLLRNIGSGINMLFQLTDLGSQVASQLRAFKGKGGNFCDFTPQATA
jgi:hypothetical protein